MKKSGLLFLSLSLLIFPVLATASGLDIQTLIDQAQPGEVVQVPAGAYRVNLVLKAGVVLEGAGSELTILDGGGVGPVIVAEDGGVIKGFTITNGIEGVKISGGPAGVFENIITANSGSGVRVGGGSALIVNNLISDNRGVAGIDGARAHILAVNNTLSGGRAGFSFWICPSSTVVNNMVVSSECGLTVTPAGADNSGFEFYNNLLSGTEVDYSQFSPTGENFSEAGVISVFCLEEDSPYRQSGVAVSAVAQELTGGIGALLPTVFPLETYLQGMQEFRGPDSGERSLVEYELLNEPGVFRVSTFFARPEFKIASSTSSTRIEGPAAYDRETLKELIDRMVNEDPPSVEVWGWGGVDYPRGDDRYVLESFFTKPESYYSDPAGNLHFVRETNFARIRVLIPEGYRVESLAPEGEIDLKTGAVSILNPTRDLIEVNLIFSPF